MVRMSFCFYWVGFIARFCWLDLQSLSLLFTFPWLHQRRSNLCQLLADRFSLHDGISRSAYRLCFCSWPLIGIFLSSCSWYDSSFWARCQMRSRRRQTTLSRWFCCWCQRRHFAGLLVGPLQLWRGGGFCVWTCASPALSLFVSMIWQSVSCTNYCLWCDQIDTSSIFVSLSSSSL